MGKYSNFCINGCYLYFTMKDLKEPFHAHISDRNLNEMTAAKLFIRADGTSVIVKKGKIKDETIKTLQKYLQSNYKKFFEIWKAAGGNPNFYNK